MMGRPDDDDLVRMYPLNVRQPGLHGEYFMLSWSTHPEQGHVTLARNERALLDTWAGLLSMWTTRRWSIMTEAEIKNMHKITIVRPPRFLEVLYANQQYDNDITNFQHWLAQSLDDLAPEEQDPLPSDMSRCLRYDPDPPYVPDPDDDPNDEAYMLESYNSEHINCKNCFRRWVFDNETMFVRHRDAYCQDTGVPISSACTFSNRVPMHDPSRILSAVLEDCRSHGYGVYLDNVAGVHSLSTVKFFCHAVDLPVPAAFRAVQEKISIDVIEAGKALRQARDDRVRAREIERKSELKKIFGLP